MGWQGAEEDQQASNLNSQVQAMVTEISSISKQLTRSNEGSTKLWEKQVIMERDIHAKIGEQQTNTLVRNSIKDTNRSVSDIRAQAVTTANDLKRAKSDLKALSDCYKDDQKAVTDNLANHKIDTRSNLHKLSKRITALDKKVDILESQNSQMLKRISDQQRDFRKEQTVVARMQNRLTMLEKRQSTQGKDIQNNQDDCKHIQEQLADKTHNRQNIVNTTAPSAGFCYSDRRGVELNLGSASPSKGSTVATTSKDNINRGDLDITLEVDTSDDIKEKLAHSKPGKVVANSKHILNCLRSPHEIPGLASPNQVIANADNWIEKRQQHLAQPLLMAHHFSNDGMVTRYKKDTKDWADSVAKGSASWCIHGCSAENYKPLRRASASSGAKGAIYVVCGTKDHGSTYALVARSTASVDSMPEIDLQAVRPSYAVLDNQYEPPGPAHDEVEHDTEPQYNNSADEDEQDGGQSPLVFAEETESEQSLVQQESEDLQQQHEAARRAAGAQGKKRKSTDDVSRRTRSR